MYLGECALISSPQSSRGVCKMRCHPVYRLAELVKTTSGAGCTYHIVEIELLYPECYSEFPLLPSMESLPTGRGKPNRYHRRLWRQVGHDLRSPTHPQIEPQALPSGCQSAMERMMESRLRGLSIGHHSLIQRLFLYPHPLLRLPFWKGSQETAERMVSLQVVVWFVD